MTWYEVAADPCTEPDPVRVWRAFDAGRPPPARHVLHPDGGSAGGPWRELTVYPGDDLGFSGIRAELGANNRADTFILLNEGDHAQITMHMRLGEDFKIDSDRWGGVLQLKQCQPYAPCGNVPMIDLGAFGGKLRFTTADAKALVLTDHHYWTPPPPGEWFRVRLNGYFTQGPGGWVSMSINGETSWRYYGTTLLRACADYEGWVGGPTSIRAGESIPNHLRVGPYTDASRGQQSLGVDRVRVQFSTLRQ